MGGDTHPTLAVPKMGKLESTAKHKSFRLTGTLEAERLPGPSSLRTAFHWSIVQQGILVLLAALVLDGGIIFQRVLVAMIAFWCFVLVLLIRRRTQPTSGDILFIKFGFWPLIVIAVVITTVLGRL